MESISITPFKALLPYSHQPLSQAQVRRTPPDRFLVFFFLFGFFLRGHHLDLIQIPLIQTRSEVDLDGIDRKPAASNHLLPLVFRLSFFSFLVFGFLGLEVVSSVPGPLNSLIKFSSPTSNKHLLKPLLNHKTHPRCNFHLSPLPFPVPVRRLFPHSLRHRTRHNPPPSPVNRPVDNSSKPLRPRPDLACKLPHHAVPECAQTSLRHGLLFGSAVEAARGAGE